MAPTWSPGRPPVAETACYCGWPETTWAGVCKVHELKAASIRLEKAGLFVAAKRLEDQAERLRRAREGLLR